VPERPGHQRTLQGLSATEDSLRLIGEGPRLDLGTANYTAWFWMFSWPSGAPAGTAIDFDVYRGRATFGTSTVGR
jgi:hypothetical protein